MKFERGKSVKDSIDIGIKQAIKKLVAEEVQKAIIGAITLTRTDLAKKIQELTGYEEVKDISNYDYPYILKYRFVKDGEIGIITINTKLDEI